MRSNNFEKLKIVKAICFDVDGVLTDGKIILDAQGREMKEFNVKDGQLIAFMMQLGFNFGCISGRSSEALASRMMSLNVPFVRMGLDNKLKALKEFQQILDIKENELLYIGDDVNDLSCLKYAGISVTPFDGKVQNYHNCDIVTKARGGEGVLREIIDMIIHAKDLKGELLIWSVNR